MYGFDTERASWKQSAAGLPGAFGVLTDVEGLTVVCYEMEPFL